MPKKKQIEHKSNLVWWIVGGIVVVVAMLIIFSNKTGKSIYNVGDVVYKTSSRCYNIDSTTIKCECDIVIDNDAKHYGFSNELSATSCDNDICSNLCQSYAEELVNK